MIRKAVMEDMPKLFELGKRIHSNSADCAVKLDEVATKMRVASLITSSQGFVLVDEVNGEITGCVIGQCDEIFFSRQKYAIPFVSYAERRGAFIWMHKRFMRWALQQKMVKQVILDTSFGGPLGEKTEAIYAKLGYEKAGSTFIVRAPCQKS